MELLTRELARSTSAGSNLTVLLARVDSFRNTNRESGENKHSPSLGRIAQCLVTSVHRYHCVGRYSEGEFLILAPGGSVSGAVPLAEKLRQAVAESGIESAGSTNRATISIALATSSDFDLNEQNKVLRQLENTLDRAEANGGNRVESLSNVYGATHPVLARRRRPRIPWWMVAGLFVLVIATVILIEPSWTCAPNLVGDIIDSGELPPPLPANCIRTTDRPTDAMMQSIERQRQAGTLEFQGIVTCKILSRNSSGQPQDMQWLGGLYPNGKLQYRRRVLIVASQEVPGGRLFTVEEALVPWWRYLSQPQEYCRVQEPPWS
jgi:diguanylate cyclase (GGDEF)-like protein